MIKKLSVVIIGLLVVVLAGVVGGAVWWRQVARAPGSDVNQKRLIIERGSSSEKIGQELEKAGLIRNALAFKVYMQLKGLTKRVPPGEFRMAGNLNLAEVVEVLLKGPMELWVTVPEGLRREEVAEKVIQSLELEDQEASNFRAEFLAETEGMEGFLFPDTYLFPRDVGAERVAEVMRGTFNKKFSRRAGQGLAEGLTLEEIVTLASIVERETKTNEERPVVAGIYLKRLRSGWTLDACATVQYTLGKPGSWWVQITPEDREIRSAYNTYINGGLPPGPICNPGLSSLEAVAESTESPYWFYIHDSEGKIHYGRTIEEQNRNIEKYLK